MADIQKTAAQVTALIEAVGTATNNGEYSLITTNNIADSVGLLGLATVATTGSYSDLTNKPNIQNAYSNVAYGYNSSSTYAVGDYAIRNDQLYRCTTPITSGEAWNASHWTLVDLGSDVTDLASDVTDLANALEELSGATSVVISVSGTTLVINTNLTNGNEVSY